MVNKKQVIIFMLILIGLIISLYLVFTRQIFKSKAVMVNRPFEISQGTGESRKSVECNDNICPISSLDIFIKPKKPENQPNAPVKAIIIAPTPSGR